MAIRADDTAGAASVRRCCPPRVLPGRPLLPAVERIEHRDAVGSQTTGLTVVVNDLATGFAPAPAIADNGRGEGKDAPAGSLRARLRR